MRTDPIVLLGMHRSGTSLLGEVFSEAGIFMGKKVEAHGEALFFLRLNEWILERSGGKWDDPGGLRSLLNDRDRVTETLRAMREQLDGLRFHFSYLGLTRMSAFQSEEFLWGWKEPRTTVTWPLWHRLFPKAKVIFLHRHGVDVANSLFVREQARKEKGSRDPFFSARCLSLQESFRLWEEYNRAFLEFYDREAPDNVLFVSYEALLAEPSKRLGEIEIFLDLPAGQMSSTAATSRMDSSKALAFQKSRQLVEFAALVEDSPLLSRLGYR